MVMRAVTLAAQAATAADSQKFRRSSNDLCNRFSRACRPLFAVVVWLLAVEAPVVVRLRAELQTALGTGPS